jgi:hypothetical protein
VSAPRGYALSMPRTRARVQDVGAPLRGVLGFPGRALGLGRRCLTQPRDHLARLPAKKSRSSSLHSLYAPPMKNSTAGHVPVPCVVGRYTRTAILPCVATGGRAEREATQQVLGVVDTPARRNQIADSTSAERAVSARCRAGRIGFWLVEGRRLSTTSCEPTGSPLSANRGVRRCV